MKAAEYEKPLVEKYRPVVLKDVVGNCIAVDQLKAIAEKGNLPNIIVVGPPGTGKTSSVMCLAREMLKDTYKEAVLELNASDERGIEVVREKIKSFAHQKVVVPENMHKIIILDEADSMTESAQQALRMVMTEYTDTTRFALACNDSSKIIEPIQSRCAIIRFTKLQDDEISERLIYVMNEEEIEFEEGGLEALLQTLQYIKTHVFTADGDMRYALNNLQATVAGFGKVSKEYVYRVCDQPHPEIIQEIIELCLQGKFEKATEKVNVFYEEGYNLIDIISSLTKLIQTFEMDDERRLTYLRISAECKMEVLEGMNSQLQLHKFIALLCSSG